MTRQRWTNKSIAHLCFDFPAKRVENPVIFPYVSELKQLAAVGLSLVIVVEGGVHSLNERIALKAIAALPK